MLGWSSCEHLQKGIDGNRRDVLRRRVATFGRSRLTHGPPLRRFTLFRPLWPHLWICRLNALALGEPADSISVPAVPWPGRRSSTFHLVARSRQAYFCCHATK